MNCRHCQNSLEHVFLDLGFAPPSNAYLSHKALSQVEKYYPLKLFVCDHCWLVQTDDYAEADELFSPDYAYFSSVSSTWLAHAKDYASMICKKLDLGKDSFVIEVASNDGYLLKNFVAKEIPCLGIEPTKSTAEAAENLGIPVLQEFFGADLGRKLSKNNQAADLIAGNNVLAHVPDINDFVEGLKLALKNTGTITLEFPHLLNLIEQKQFDTVYHEHFSYLSLNTVCCIFKKAKLRVFDVEKLPTHGGSLRIYACHEEDPRGETTELRSLLQVEIDSGLQELDCYLKFQEQANLIKDGLLNFLLEKKQQGKRVAAYGAAAKGNTLLNYAGIKGDLLPYVFDAAPSKQNKFLPGSHIPILAPKQLEEIRPDYLLILPWNISKEVVEENKRIREWGGQFVTAIPTMQEIS
jgi:hypothetical protein